MRRNAFRMMMPMMRMDMMTMCMMRRANTGHLRTVFQR